MQPPVDEELAADYAHADQLEAQNTRLEENWADAQREAQLARQSIRDKLATKSDLARAIFDREQRRAEIQINFGRFEQLQSVYQSDIERLEAIEEAGFVLALGGDKPCPLCGANQPIVATTKHPAKSRDRSCRGAPVIVRG